MKAIKKLKELIKKEHENATGNKERITCLEDAIYDHRQAICNCEKEIDRLESIQDENIQKLIFDFIYKRLDIESRDKLIVTCRNTCNINVRLENREYFLDNWNVAFDTDFNFKLKPSFKTAEYQKYDGRKIVTALEGLIKMLNS